VDDLADTGAPYEGERLYARPVARGADDTGAGDQVEDWTYDDEDFERRVARRRPGADVEELLRDVLDILDEARPVALSTAVKVDRDELWDLVEQALERLPHELRSARWLLKERDEFLARTHREADEILAAARGQSERMVQRSEVMRSAEATARRIVDESRAEAARIRNACDDYCDQRLAQLEAVLERSLDVVAAGREKLRPTYEDSPPAGAPAAGDDRTDAPEETGDEVDVQVFDQDRL
jgi:hypothetical protein